jgi:replicative DNA helicase
MTDYITPNNPEAEMAVLSCCMQGKMAYAMKAGVTQTDFYEGANKAIWNACLSLFNQSQSIDLTSVGIRLTETGMLNKVGSLAYLNDILDHCASPEPIPHYIESLLRESKRRELKELCFRSMQAIDSKQTPIQDIIESFSEQLIRLNQSEQPSLSTIDALRKLVDEIADRADGAKPTGVLTNHQCFRKYFPKLDETSFTVIAARPGQGKTSLGLDLADTMATPDTKVKFYSLEMPQEQMLRKYMSHVNGVDTTAIEMGVFDKQDLTKLGQAVDYIQKKTIDFIDAPGLNCSQLAADIALWKANNEVDIVFIDYLQLMNGPPEYKGNRVAEVTAITRLIKQIAMRYKVPIVCLCQINRSSTQENRKPRMTDLRESGSIEQDANNIIFIYTPDENNTTNHITPVELLIAKNRMGEAPGLVRAYFNKPTSEFITEEQYIQIPKAH